MSSSRVKCNHEERRTRRIQVGFNNPAGTEADPSSSRYWDFAETRRLQLDWALLSGACPTNAYGLVFPWT